MAAAGPLQNLKAEVTCPICMELFRDPVTTECGHSFCRECIARLCQGDGDVACPLCNEKLRKGNLRPNRELRNIVALLKSQTVEEPRRGNMCQMHGKSLLLYCQVDQTPICLVCRESQAHRGHTVVPVEEAVQEHWETMKKQLEGIKSTYGRLHLLVSMDRKHLSPSAGEEMHKMLKRLTDSTATLFKVHTEGPRQRFEALASQPQPREPDGRGRGRGVATRSELRECQGREPGSEPAAEKQEETGTHVGRVCEEAPTPKYGLDQATLDPGVHTISNTTESEEFKAYVKSVVSRFDSPTSPAPSQVSAGDQAGVSPAGQGAAQTESGDDTGTGGRGSQEPNTAAADVHRQASPFPVYPRRSMSQPVSGIHRQLEEPSRLWDSSRVRRLIQQEGAIRLRLLSDGDGRPASIPALSREDENSHRKSFQDLRSLRAAVGSEGSRKGGLSAPGNVALQAELWECEVEVTLDPATAHPQLVLSEDRKSVERGDPWQDLPDTPERFDTSVSVLGSQGFTSGKRYWEVEVGGGGYWAIGVARDSVRRKGKIPLKPDDGIWALTSLETFPFLRKRPRKVGVYLDYERGEVRFYNAETIALISSLTATFTGRLVPFFYLWTEGSYMKLYPCQK